ncbi:RNA methylase [Viridothelium virens]|uniref:tRNA (guanine(10)-N(2))-methyltransferase n=1 Tax=Viridothelium virens TaxID=1048519 RepID=A0A6A6HBM7_VIRVR|nr:RNA methylase [Viridothelium virens]
MEYLVRFAQVHTGFHAAELESLASLNGIELEILKYSANSPFCIVWLASEESARRLISRSILASGIYEVWGSGNDYATLHEDVLSRTSQIRPKYRKSSFRFTVDGYQGKRSQASQRALIESFSYLGFDGPIRMHNVELNICLFEEYQAHAPEPERVFLGRWLAESSRAAVTKYDLKKRHYISTTSMDAEVALVTANMVQAQPGKLVYDPFVGTGSLLIACAHFGAVTIGSDIDGRCIRGKAERHIVSNYQQYQLLHRYLDGFISDLTHCPLRQTRLLDGIVCDPPYGVREGLKVLGTKDGSGKEEVIIDGVPAHLRPNFIPPKKPYSFEAMLDDVLEFAASSLVESGRLCMWMPSANEDEVELEIPTHPALEIVAVCVQPFNKWSRRLLTYRRLPDADIRDETPRAKKEQAVGAHADELNRFRKKYFEGFKTTSKDI